MWWIVSGGGLSSENYNLVVDCHVILKFLNDKDLKVGDRRTVTEIDGSQHFRLSEKSSGLNHSK